MNKTVLEGVSAPIIEYIENLEARIENLTELLILAQNARFGSSSEKAKYILDDGFEQDTLFNEAEAYADEDVGEDEPETVTVEKHERKAKRTREELAENLPVKETVIDVPEEDRICGICEGSLNAIGRELVRRELGMIPAQAFVEETYRINYGCKCCLEESDEANIVKPDVPAPVVKRGLASPGSVAYVMYQKFVNSMPLYRQSKDLANFGVEIPRSTLANWIIFTSLNWLLPLWLALKAILLESPVINADESVLQVLKEPGKTPQSDSYMWVYCTGKYLERSPPIILFEYRSSRAGENPKAFLEGVNNPYLQTDGYKAYNSVENVVHCGCWSHMRRYVKEAMPKDAPKDNVARIGFEICQELFLLERKFEDMTPEERVTQRLVQSKPVLDKFYDWVSNVNPLAGSKLAKAITYAINQKVKLSAFLLDGRIDLSNNFAENQIRPFVVGRKNFLFCDSVRGAKASAVAYSIVRTATENGLNPYQYMLYLFTHLPTVLTKNPDADLSSFFPWSEVIQAKCKYAQGEKGQLSLLC